MFSANNQLLLKNNKNKKAEIKEKERRTGRTWVINP